MSQAHAPSDGGFPSIFWLSRLSAASSLRGLEASFNANSQQHYHLGSGQLLRSTLSDANRRRPVAVFAETFAHLAGQLDRRARREGKQMLRLINSTPIPLGKLCDWAKSNGRIRGLKLHVFYDPRADCPRILDITDANVNDAQIGRGLAIEPGATYVFDKGYCHYGWRTAIAEAKAVFVTRPKSNMGLKVLRQRRLASKGDSKLPIALRRITVRRANGDTITLLTNDLKCPAVAIASSTRAAGRSSLCSAGSSSTSRSASSSATTTTPSACRSSPR